MSKQPTKNPKSKALDLLLQGGFASDAKAAGGLILAGLVYAGDKRVTSPGQLLPAGCALRVKGQGMPYASKGYLKLAGALEDFTIDVTGRVCVDAGASTGGFTDCLLRHGAALVYAVDVGFGQLTGALRQDKRVMNMERTNISDAKLLSLDPRPDVGTVDLSYLSLRKGVPAFAEILGRSGDIICLVKPLFEARDSVARRTGVLPPDAYAPILRDVIADINRLPDARVAGVAHSHVTGNAGTREFFLHVKLSAPPGPQPDLSDAIENAVARAMALPVYSTSAAAWPPRSSEF